jgi:Dienelactone hydrolase and related enzymes
MKDLTRRQFITVTALSAGFALAVHPIAAAVINTDAAGLIAGEVKIPVKDGSIPAYRAMPASGSNFPVILVIQEIFGVHAHIQDICRRLAKLGYLAIAPEMFARQGDVSKITDIQEIRSKVVSKVPDAQAMSDLDATVDWAQKSAKGNINKLGITGFCWGGRMVWLYSSHNPKVKAGVAWYGRLVGNSTALTPKHPIDIAANLKVPVLGLYGGKDEQFPTIQSRKCGKFSKLAAAVPKLCFIQIRRTLLTPTIAPLTGKKKLRMLGNGCKIGLRSTELHNSFEF